MKNVDLVRMENLEFQYDRYHDGATGKTQVLNFWKDKSSGQYYDCVLGVYPKEWMISE